MPARVVQNPPRAPARVLRSALTRVGAHTRFLPALVILAVFVLDVLTGTCAVVVTPVLIAPLLAASLLSVRATATYAVLALAGGAVLGVRGDRYDSELGTQLVRLSTILIGGAMAVAAARVRLAREHRLTRVLKIAAVAQSAILPPVPPRLGPVNVAASYDSAQEEAAVGGDVYAAVQSPFGVRLLLADVRGHGLEAVHLAATVLGAFRERAYERGDLRELARDLDRAVARAGGEEDFVTAVLAEVHAGVLRVVNAGHLAPVLLRAGTAVGLDPRHPALPLGLGLGSGGGSGTDLDVEQSQIHLEAGDRVLLYTDGVTEARRPDDGEFFPLTRLVVPCLGTGALSAGLAELRAAVVDWVRGPVQDDVTVLAFEYAPRPGTSDGV